MLTPEMRTALRDMAQGEVAATIEVGSIGGEPGEPREEVAFIHPTEKGAITPHAQMTLERVERTAASLLLVCDALRVARDSG